MDSYEERVKHLQSVSRGLREYLNSLPHEAWSRPSACHRWRVDDVVAHLVAVAESYAQTVSRGRQRAASPPPGRQPAGADTGASAAERIATGAIAMRERLGDGLLAAFEEAVSDLNRILTNLSPEEQSLPCYHPGGTVPAGNFIDLWLNELTIHQWDIQSSLEADARLSPQGLPSTALMFTRSLAAGALRWAFWPGPKLPTPVRYRFEVTGPIPLNADIAVEGDQVRLEEPGTGVSDIVFRCDTETFVLLMYGRLTAAEAIDRGSLETQGDPGDVARFSQWFRGI